MNALIILDGFGVSDQTKGNAIYASGMPYYNSLITRYPHTTIGASGLDVGLPDGQMGNSEVGHVNMGAGRVVYQELTRITKEIQTGEFFENEALLAAIENAKKQNRALHTFGLLSNGGVHSHIDHLKALVTMAKAKGLSNIYIHCFMDGRDVSPTSGADFLKELQDFLNEQQFGKIASVMGRFYAMDRDSRWDRVEKAYACLTAGEGTRALSAEQAVRDSYKEGITDEFIPPIVLVDDFGPIRRIEEKDSIVFFNFRPDRAREITRAFTKRSFADFERQTGYLAPTYVCFTQYDASLRGVKIAFRAQSLENNLGQVIAKHGLKQLRVAETEKYAHVTFFFNSGVEEQNEGEERILIPSPKVATYDLVPEMSAQQVADAAAARIAKGDIDLLILNFANCDMVGHTGIFDAAVLAAKAVDKALKTIVDAILAVGGNAIVTADHGNAEQMYDTDGVSPFTPHTTNPVPLVVVKDGAFSLKSGGKLSDIAPTLLDMMGIEKPQEMTGATLIVK